MNKFKHDIDVIMVWKGQTRQTSSRGSGALVALAIRILSIVPNSASTECLFSAFGTTHTKRRNRLSPQKVHLTSLVRLDQNRRFQSSKPPRKKRRFDSSGWGTNDDTAQTPTQDMAAEAEAAAFMAAAEEDGDGNGGAYSAPSFEAIAQSLIGEAASEEQRIFEDLDDEDDESTTTYHS